MTARERWLAMAAVIGPIITGLGGSYSESLDHEENEQQLELAAEAMDHMRETIRLTNEGWASRCQR